MKTELIHTLTDTFEAHAQQTEGGVEYWLARDLQHLLGYTEWRNFTAVISKTQTVCEVSGHAPGDHFVDVNKTITMPKGAEKEVPDIMLTRYACYLIAQNGDPRKEEIAFAQTYFAVQTRRAELIEQRLLEAERVSARKKLTTTEKELSQVIYEQTGDWISVYPASEYRPGAGRRSSTFKMKYDPTLDQVAILTLHSSKGLEFQTVIMMGLNHLKEEDEELENQARVLYVGMARAREKLLLTSSAQNRYTQKVTESLKFLDS